MIERDFGAKVRKAAGWSYVAQVYQTFGAFAVGVLLARLLSPSEFGIFILVTAFTSVALIAVQFGIPKALVQAKSLEEGEINSAFWMMATLSGVSICVLWGGSLPLGQLFGSEQFSPVMRSMCGVFLLTPFAGIGFALLRRNMRFYEVSMIGFASMTGGATLSVLSAVFGFGVYSLVVGAIAGTLINVMMLSKVVTWRPGWPEVFGIRKVFSYSGYTTITNIFNLAAGRIDNVLVGAFLGLAGLGLYNRAYSLARMPSDQFSESLGPVVLGSLSRIQDDVYWSRLMYFKAASAISIVTMPFLAFLFVGGPLAIEFLYGEQWIDAGQPLQGMVIGGVFVMLSSTLKSVIDAQGLVRAAIPIAVTSFLATVVVVISLERFGLLAVALGISLRELLVFVLSVRLLNGSCLTLSFRDIAHSVAPSLLGSGVALTVGIWASREENRFFADHLGWFLLFLGSVVFLTYCVSVAAMMLLWRGHIPLQSTKSLVVEILRNSVKRGFLSRSAT